MNETLTIKKINDNSGKWELQKGGYYLASGIVRNSVSYGTPLKLYHDNDCCNLVIGNKIDDDTYEILSLEEFREQKINEILK